MLCFKLELRAPSTIIIVTKTPLRCIETRLTIPHSHVTTDLFLPLNSNLLHSIPVFLKHLLCQKKEDTQHPTKQATMVERANRPSAISANTTGPQPSVQSDGTKVTATLPTGESVEVYLYGATVTSWKSGGKEHLWLSESAVMDGSKAIRGGVPVVFPVSMIDGEEYSIYPTSRAPRNMQPERLPD